MKILSQELQPGMKSICINISKDPNQNQEVKNIHVVTENMGSVVVKFAKIISEKYDFRRSKR